MTPQAHRRRDRPPRRTLQRAVVAVSLAVMVAVSTTPAQDVPRRRPQRPVAQGIHLTITLNAAEYDRDEPIFMTLTLTTDPDFEGFVTVSPDAAGNLGVLTLTRDGIPIAPDIAPTFFETDPRPIQATRLRILSRFTQVDIPQVDIPFEPILDEGGGAQLEIVSLSGPPQVWRYSLTEPGLYELSLIYQYDPDDPRQDVMRNPVLSNTVQFRRR
jgi:hypothetical protein